MRENEGHNGVERGGADSGGADSGGADSGGEFALAHSVLKGGAAKEGGPVGVILHGILGSGGNWRSFARRWVLDLPQWSVLLVDLRNHGSSGLGRPPHTVQACAGDVVRLLGNMGVTPAAVVGHSFGGKVAIVAAEPWRASGVDGLVTISLDSPPGPRVGAESASGVERVVAALKAVPMPQPGRKALVEALLERGVGPSIAQWMTTNVRMRDGALEWVFELGAVEEMLASFAALDLWPAVLDAGGAAPVLVRARRSGLWEGAEGRRFEAFAAEAPHRALWLEDADHWLHVDNPEGLWALMLALLASAERNNP